jgi:hypothetical protein
MVVTDKMTSSGGYIHECRHLGAELDTLSSDYPSFETPVLQHTTSNKILIVSSISDIESLPHQELYACQLPQTFPRSANKNILSACVHFPTVCRPTTTLFKYKHK